MTDAEILARKILTWDGDAWLRGEVDLDDDADLPITKRELARILKNVGMAMRSAIGTKRDY